MESGKLRDKRYFEERAMRQLREDPRHSSSQVRLARTARAMGTTVSRLASSATIRGSSILVGLRSIASGEKRSLVASSICASASASLCVLGRASGATPAATEGGQT
jgi:hypothetical protein